MTPAISADPAGGFGALGGAEGKKYMTLRKRLDQMGYRQSLGVDSLPLVEKLFNDLVQTTESLKKTKQQATKVSNQIRLYIVELKKMIDSELTVLKGILAYFVFK